jgi:hypothetical protein
MRSGRFKKIGAIKSIADIPFDEDLIVSGSVNKTCWVWRMPGEFKRKGNEVIFEDTHGMTSTVDEKINLAIITRKKGYDD